MPEEFGFPAGTVLAGRYRVERMLGSGGMGVVLATEDLKQGTRGAMKVLRPSALEKPELIARFHREARAAGKIDSEHIARVLDTGRLESGAPYMVMEYLEGADLSEELKARGPLPSSVAVGYVLQACEALALAHAAGIIHRDLKPANLFLTRRPDGSPLVKVLDFGISKVTDGGGGDGETTSLTATSVMMGSPHYMSPEQLRSARDVDARTDIWALGAVLFRLLARRSAWNGETTAEVCSEILMGVPRSLAELAPGTPAGLEAVILRCLSKKREDRYPSVTALVEALAPFASRGDGVPSLPAPAPRATAPDEPAALAPADISLLTDPRSSPAAVISSAPSRPAATRASRGALALAVAAPVLIVGMVVAARALRSTELPPHAVASAASVAPVGATDLPPTEPVVVPTGIVVPPAPSASATATPKARAAAPPVQRLAPAPAPAPAPTTRQGFGDRQ